jgi:uncharacterized paraquat-inducible protein A
MNRTKNVKGNCGECGASLTFPAESVGTIAQCPQCGRQAELLLARPEIESGIARRTVIWTAVTVVILALGLGGVLYALKRAENWAARHKSTTAAPADPGSSRTTEPGR